MWQEEHWSVNYWYSVILTLSRSLLCVGKMKLVLTDSTGLQISSYYNFSVTFVSPKGLDFLKSSKEGLCVITHTYLLFWYNFFRLIFFRKNSWKPCQYWWVWPKLIFYRASNDKKDCKKLDKPNEQTHWIRLYRLVVMRCYIKVFSLNNLEKWDKLVYLDVMLS